MNNMHPAGDGSHRARVRGCAWLAVRGTTRKTPVKYRRVRQGRTRFFERILQPSQRLQPIQLGRPQPTLNRSSTFSRAFRSSEQPIISVHRAIAVLANTSTGTSIQTRYERLLMLFCFRHLSHFVKKCDLAWTVNSPVCRHGLKAFIRTFTLAAIVKKSPRSIVEYG